jgi:hypothetical protein
VTDQMSEQLKAGDLAWFQEGGLVEQVEIVQVLTPEDVDAARDWTDHERRVFKGYRLRVTIGAKPGEEYTVWGVYPGGWYLERCREPFLSLPENDPVL